MFERASDYSRCRPKPPASLVPLLTRLACGSESPSVVDLGCGTGLSTRVWLGHAREIIGVDRSEPMLAEARRSATEIRWLQGDASDTKLPSGSADVVTVVQALHWMEPERTLAEIARVLRVGGVFAAVDAAFPPLIEPELDLAFRRFLQRCATRLDDQTPRWEKEGHLRRLQESGWFSETRELDLQGVEHGDAQRLIGLAEGAVDLPRLYELGASDRELGLDALRGAAERVLGRRAAVWRFDFRVILSVK